MRINGGDMPLGKLPGEGGLKKGTSEQAWGAGRSAARSRKNSQARQALASMRDPSRFKKPPMRKEKDRRGRW